MPMKTLLVAAVWAVLFVIAAFVKLPIALGAHPWWAVDVVWQGLFAGILLLAIAVKTGVSQPFAFLVFATLTVTAAAIVAIGKARFAASFAEDAVAGRMWHWGWISVIGVFFATAVVGTLHALDRRR